MRGYLNLNHIHLYTLKNTEKDLGYGLITLSYSHRAGINSPNVLVRTRIAENNNFLMSIFISHHVSPFRQWLDSRYHQSASIYVQKGSFPPG